jgi:hypothetical protein
MSTSPRRERSDGNLHHNDAVYGAGDQGHPGDLRSGGRVQAAAKKMGVKVTGIYWTLGAFDGVIISEAGRGDPDRRPAAVIPG